MYLPQWLLKALRQALCGHAGGRSPLKAILFLWRFFRCLFWRFSRIQDDGEPDKPPRHIANQGSYLPQSVEPTKCTMSLAADGNADEPVQAVVCRSAAPPYDPWSSHDIVTMSVASHSQTDLAFETELNPSNEHPPLHGSCPPSITSSSIEGSLYSSAHSNFSRLSQGISSTVQNSATDAHQNSLDGHLPPARPTSGQRGLSSGFEAPQPPTAAQRGQNQDGASNSTLHDVHPHIMTVIPDDAGIFGAGCVHSMVIFASSSDMFQTEEAIRPRPPPGCSSDDIILSVRLCFFITFSSPISCFRPATVFPVIGRHMYILRVLVIMHIKKCYTHRQIPCRHSVSFCYRFLLKQISLFQKCCMH